VLLEKDRASKVYRIIFMTENFLVGGKENIKKETNMVIRIVNVH